jgi:arabinogalactan endo-1,4-beta-galactosidase
MKQYRAVGLSCAAITVGLIVVAVTTGCAGSQERPSATGVAPFCFGADLSYVNEVEDFGAEFHENGTTVDPFELFSANGYNAARARLWHNPDWTEYSTLQDVTRTFKRAREAGMALLLDFHYADEWADPSKQYIPAAWEGMNDEEMAEAVHDYTYDTLIALHRQGVLPELVQVGNETNSGMLRDRGDTDWARQALLFNAGIQGVRDAEPRNGSTSSSISLNPRTPSGSSKAQLLLESSTLTSSASPTTPSGAIPRSTRPAVSSVGSAASLTER